jgi:hypothetical protein
VSQGLKPLVSRRPVMPGLKSGPISEAKATTEEVYAEGCVGGTVWCGCRQVVWVAIVFEIGPGFSPDNQSGSTRCGLAPGYSRACPRG